MHLSHPHTTAMILAGGSGSRMGREGLPKQLRPLCGKPMLYHTISAFAKTPIIDAIVVVTREADREAVEEIAKEASNGKPYAITLGGDTRMDSAYAGLLACDENTTFVAIHDGARCLISPEDIVAVCECAYLHQAATAAAPLVDTIKQIKPDGTISHTLDRNQLYAAQTPQVFSKEKYEQAIKSAQSRGECYTDDNALFEAMGWQVRCVLCQHENPKITFLGDLEWAEHILYKRMNKEKSKAKMRISHGYDVHCLKAGRRLIVGGVDIPHTMGLDGHSDADVLVHAIMDALLGAAGLPNIGQLFPDNDPRYRGIDSLLLLSEVGKQLSAQGFTIGNIDATIVAQAPKL
ncbi:MAG: 2-C-methyl-D-erythritol 4-phosphate cytidylyltransferase, partial [Clostridia bacterium]|nr:2-C-methyl-D-erythritol 4-phosphate cytidylyltransferase [Clostridia bacterium]